MDKSKEHPNKNFLNKFKNMTDSNFAKQILFHQQIYIQINDIFYKTLLSNQHTIFNHFFLEKGKFFFLFLKHLTNL